MAFLRYPLKSHFWLSFGFCFHNTSGRSLDGKANGENMVVILNCVRFDVSDIIKYGNSNTSVSMRNKIRGLI